MHLTSDEHCIGADDSAGTAPICHNCLRQSITARGIYIPPAAYRDAAGEWQCTERRSAGVTEHDGANVRRTAGRGNPESVGGVSA